MGIGAEVAFGDPIDEAVADGVGDELLIGVAGHDHGAAGEEGRGLGDGAPEEAAGEFGVAFVGVEDVAGDGVDAVGADEDIAGLGGLRGVGVAVEEVGGDLVGGVVDGLEVVGCSYGLRAEAGGDGAPEEFEEAAAVDGVLGPEVAGGEAAGFAPDALAAFCVVGEFGGGDAGLGEFVGEAEVGEDADGVGEEVDAYAEGSHGVGGFEDTDFDVALVEGEGGGEAADAGSADEDGHLAIVWERRGRGGSG